MNAKRNTSELPLPCVQPEDVGMSSGRLAKLRPRLQKYIDEGKLPNLVTLVARHGKIVHLEAQGYADIETKTPATAGSIYRLWSNSKPIAGAATMICVEEGLLTLDDPVSKWLPTFKNPVIMVPPDRPDLGRATPGMIPTMPAHREITVRDCLRNTTGLMTAKRAPVQYLTDYSEAAAKNVWSPVAGGKPTRDVIEVQGRVPLAFEPGSEFEYHVGYPVLGVVLEMATGKTPEAFYQERIFKPLGMNDTSFFLPRRKVEHFTSCYRPLRAGERWKLAVAERAAESDKVKGPKDFCGVGGDNGGLLSTAGDYVRFAQMLLNGGELDGARILGRKSVELMTMNHLRDDIYPNISGPGTGFGMGVGVYKGGGVPRMRSVGAYGWGGAAGTTWFNDPKEGLIAICFTQVLQHRVMPGNTYQEEFEDLVYQALL